MTFREKLQQEHPDRIDPTENGGCIGCPSHYGYERNHKCPSQYDLEELSDNEACTRCWDREISCQTKIFNGPEINNNINLKSAGFVLVLHEKPVDSGLTRSEAIDLIDMLNCDKFYPIQIEATLVESIAMGSVSREWFDSLDLGAGEDNQLDEFVGNIMNDMNNESEDCTYEFKGRKIWLSR